ncbi:MAG: polyprenol monophosphomannose synthase [Deltaproteobacteria bacterium]|nr:polyprenol monophosphomannose synthase [Deltaproteobacteria bacterium]
MSDGILIIVPTYNERDNLGPITAQILEQLPEAHLLVVDDNSPDGTGELADELARADGRVHVLHRPGKQGLGRAYLAGFRWGLERSYEYLVEMDADFSHDPRYLPQLVARARAGADLVLGSRYAAGGGTENWGLVRQMISRGGSLYARTVLGVRVRDLTGGFKCFRRRVLETLDLEGVRSEGYAFQIEMTYRALKQGFRVEELPIVFVDRRVGQSKMSRKIFAEAVWMVWRLRLTVRGK